MQDLLFRDLGLKTPIHAYSPFLPSVESIRGFAHAAGFATARRCLQFLVCIMWFIRTLYETVNVIWCLRRQFRS